MCVCVCVLHSVPFCAHIHQYIYLSLCSRGLPSSFSAEGSSKAWAWLEQGIGPSGEFDPSDHRHVIAAGSAVGIRVPHVRGQSGQAPPSHPPTPSPLQCRLLQMWQQLFRLGPTALLSPRLVTYHPESPGSPATLLIVRSLRRANFDIRDERESSGVN